MHIHIFHNMFVEFEKSFNMTDKHVYNQFHTSTLFINA